VCVLGWAPICLAFGHCNYFSDTLHAAPLTAVGFCSGPIVVIVVLLKEATAVTCNRTSQLLRRDEDEEDGRPGVSWCIAP
jgi:hypothetical protein